MAGIYSGDYDLCKFGCVLEVSHVCINKKKEGIT